MSFEDWNLLWNNEKTAEFYKILRSCTCIKDGTQPKVKSTHWNK